MKICYDTLEKVRFIKRTGNFRQGNNTYYYYESCLKCGDDFIGQLYDKYCSRKCMFTSSDYKQKRKEIAAGDKNPMYGKHHTEKTKQKIRESRYKYTGENHPNWKGGISNNPYCDQWRDKEYKHYIMHERDKGKCQNPQCNNKYIRIVPHHINYNKQDCRPFNLITVCISCNSRANFDREWHNAFYIEIIKRIYSSPCS